MIQAADTTCRLTEAFPPLRLQDLGMVGDVIAHEGGDEVIAVVVAGLAPQRQGGS